MAVGRMALSKMSISNLVIDDGVPTPTVSRFFNLDLFNDPIVTPDQPPDARSSFGGLRLLASGHDNQASSSAGAAPRTKPLASGSGGILFSPEEEQRVVARVLFSQLPARPSLKKQPKGYASRESNPGAGQHTSKVAFGGKQDEDTGDEGAPEPTSKRRKLNSSKPAASTGLRRYSVRSQLRQTATALDRVWSLLPTEIQLNVWDMALESELSGRVVLLQNRCSPHFNKGAVGSVNPLPDLSRVSQQARHEFERHYKRMFARIPAKNSTSDMIRTRLCMLRPSIEEALKPKKALPAAGGDGFWHNRYNVPELKEPLGPKQTVSSMIESASAQIAYYLEREEEQWVNVDKDIIQIEACCDGCRGNHCVRRQFTQIDREAVRFLCLKGEPWWAMSFKIAPCWTIVSELFPNVEILYLDVNKTGPSVLFRKKRVMIRVGYMELLPLHAGCVARFEQWKQGPGKDKKLSKVELVAVYEEKRPRRGMPNGSQYTWAKMENDDVFVIR